MSEHVVLLSIPGLRRHDVDAMPCLKSLVSGGDAAELVPSFPAVTCPVQANMTTGVPPSEHGVVANGFYWPQRQKVEMWTAANECIERPQLWDIMHQHDASLRSATWFPLHSKECGADYVCTPAPIHNPDGSESLWCYTRPESLYPELIERLGHFPLQHFWGPLANIKSSAWIVDSAIHAAQAYRPNLFYIYLPHLDYAAQKSGPDSGAAQQALTDLDAELGKLIDGFLNAYGDEHLLWLVASEYVITPVDHVSYPNRVLREAGLLAVREEEDGEHLDLAGSQAWALADHQLSHLFVRDADLLSKVQKLFADQDGVAEVLTRAELDRYDLEHPRCGDLVVISTPNSWQAYYWWLDESKAPQFARTVDIHRKPGYDPVEMFWDPSTKSVPLDATLVKGSHGAPPHAP
ncbi:MAG: alkaline phosphatase family protein, partial [Pirellulales bacterium]|nr:alkaline phosphatase family protein [Pirellulales bacterium]